MNEKDLVKKTMVLLLSFDDESKSISEEAILQHLDSYSIGALVSFFHQSYGAIPIIYEPKVLGDNYNKLLELSDIAFSSGRFITNSIDEKSSIFDYELYGNQNTDQNVKVISYSFSIDKPSARGGLENYIVSIILEAEIYQIIKFFLELIDKEIHTIHTELQNLQSEKDKQKVVYEVIEVRKLIAKIILTFINTFGNEDLGIDKN